MTTACNIARNDAYDQNIVIDLEFTPVPNEAGPGCLHYEIIQIGAVRVSPDGRMLDQFCCFVRPQWAPFVSWKVQRITGIRDSALQDAPSFAQALVLLRAWIGEGRTRMVAWSGTDKAQILAECAAKGLRVPGNMDRWMDLQRVFPRAVGMRKKRTCMALHDALAWFDMEPQKGCEHQALLDAEHTAQLLISLFKGEHLEHAKAMRSAMGEGKKRSGYNVMAGALAGLLAQMQGA